MTQYDTETTAQTGPPPATGSIWRMALLWAGVPLCVFGLLANRMWEQWASGRFAELLLGAALAMTGAWLVRRFLRFAMPSVLLAAWCGALVLFSGVFPVLATALFAIAAIALGEWILGRASLALQCACGVALLAGVMGWLLPLPIHTRWSYLALCTMLIVLRRNALVRVWHDLRGHWQAAVAASPRTAVFAMIALGLASTGCWLPTMQFDDLAYHLRLPWELMENARYSMDPRTHVWLFGPWLGDVVQAMAQVVAGAEARGPVNALWMALAAAGVWQLTASLGGTARSNWMAVALYASLPLTAALAGSMQTETATVALLVWLAVVAVQVPDGSGSRAVLAGAILVGGLIALKLTGAAFATLLLPLAFWRHRGQLRARDVLLGALLVLVIGGSSYAYAGLLTGNPVFPLFNEWFRSPVLSEAVPADLRWHAGFNALLPWNLTFDTDQYQELSDGGAGFLLVALAGAWLLAFSYRRTRVVALVVTLLVALPLMHMQYLRYVFPALVLMLPLLALAAFRADPRRAAWLLAGVCVANLAFQANGHWMLRGGAVKQTVLALGRDAPLFAHYVPERNLIALLREHPRRNGNRGNVLLLDGGNPNMAELGLRGRTVTWYDPELRASARKAEADASGAAWARLMRDEDIAEVILRPETLSTAQRAALARMRGVRRASVGKAEWWSLPVPAPQLR